MSKNAPNVEGFDYISFVNSQLPEFDNVFGYQGSFDDGATTRNLYLETRVGNKWLLSMITPVIGELGYSKSFGSHVSTKFYRATATAEEVKDVCSEHIKLVKEEYARQEAENNESTLSDNDASDLQVA